MVAYTFYETDNRVKRYAEALVGRGDEVDALVLRPAGRSRFEAMKGVNVYRIQKRQRDERGPLTYLIKLVLFFLRSAWTLTWSHFKKPYDVIHVHSVPDFQVFSTLVPRLLGVKVILDIHDIVPELYASKFHISERSFTFRLLLAVEKISAAYANYVIIANHLWYEKLMQRSVPAGKCSAIINYPDMSLFVARPRNRTANDDFIMCYPGTLNQHQGVDVAVNAVALLRTKLPNLKFLIVGDGPDREKLKLMIKEQRLEDRVSLVGAVPTEQVVDIMARVDLGVVPKRKDNFGNEAFSTKIMEFMAMGVPVIASNTRIDQYYFNDRLVRFFESNNVEDLSAKILELANDSVKRAELSAQASDFIGHNDWGSKKSEYLDIVDRLVCPQLLFT